MADALPDPARPASSADADPAEALGWPLQPLADLTRRALLSRGAAFATGAGAAVFGVATVGAAMHRDTGGHGQTAETVFNVRDFGAAGDGQADDTDHLQHAINAARDTGGVVFFPPGTYLTRKLTLYSRIHLRGSGGDATTLRLHPGANSPVIESAGFAGLTGRRADGGITMFSVRDLTIDGNKAHNPKGGYGLRIYGYGYELTEVVVFNCHNDGIYSEWGPAGALAAPSHQMEARLTGLRTHDNGGHGIAFAGPHDSMMLNCVAAENSGAGFHITGDSDGTSLVNCHAWGAGQDVSFELAAAGLSCMNCYADLAGGVGVRVSRSDCRWVGGLVLGYNHPGPQQEIGIQLVPGAKDTEPAGTVVDTKIMNCGTAAVDFGADRGLSSLRAVISQPGVVDSKGAPVAGSGLGWLGSPAPTTQVEITSGLGDTAKSLVIRPAFDLRVQGTPQPPAADSVRLFARDFGGTTQLCAVFPSGVVRVVATDA